MKPHDDTEELKAARWGEAHADYLEKSAASQDFWDEIYDECERHKEFAVLGKQITDADQRRWGFRNAQQPNLLISYINLEANKTTQTDYWGKITPNGGGATLVQARAREELIRGLQRTQNVTQIYSQVRKEQITFGLGYSWRHQEWADGKTMAKTLKPEFLEDTRKVYPMPNPKSLTFSDSTYWIIKKDVKKSEWEAETGEVPEGWASEQTKEIAYFFNLESEDDFLYLMEDGSKKMESELPELKDGKFGGKDLKGVKVDDDFDPLGRELSNKTWHWYKIADGEVIDEEVLKETVSPIIAAIGRKVVSKGKVSFQGLSFFAEEPQLMYTIIENILNLRLARSPYSKWIVAFESQIGKALERLRRSSTTNDIDILYKAFTKDGKAIPPPQEQEPHTIDQALRQLQQDQLVKIERIFGTPDANFGLKSNESSGIAIENREKLGDATNYDSVYNFMEYVKQDTKLTLDQAPRYLTAPQQLMFVDRDDNAVVQWINTAGGIQMNPDESYDLSIEAMPMAASAREAESQDLFKLLTDIPLLQQNAKIVSLVIRSRNGRFTQQIADELLGMDPQKQQMQQEIQQLQTHIQQLTQSATQKLNTAQANITVLKGSLSISKQSIALLKQKHAMDVQAAQANGQPEPAEDNTWKELEQKNVQLELQIQQFEAENKAQSDQTNADANMLKAIGSLTKVNTIPAPKPGSALP